MRAHGLPVHKVAPEVDLAFVRRERDAHPGTRGF